MSNVVYLNGNNGVHLLLEYLESGFTSSHLVKGCDYEVVSLIAATGDGLSQRFRVKSFGSFLGMKSADIFKNTVGNPLAIAKHMVKKRFKDRKVTIVETPVPDNSHLAFYKIKGEVDIDLATELGLGVVRYNQEYLLYFPYIREDPIYTLYEMTMFKVYLQLLYPDQVDEAFKKGFFRNKKLIKSFMIANKSKHLKRLAAIYAPYAE